MFGTCETKILVADNNARMAESLKLLLAEEADCIVIARSLEEVDALLTVDIPDLILIDTGLAGSGTRNLIQRVHQHDPAVPVLLMTSFEDPATALALMESSAYVML